MPMVRLQLQCPQYDVSTPPQGSVPVVVTPGGRPLAGEALLQHLHDLSITEPCNTGAVCVFPLAEVGFVIELATNLCEDFAITEKVFTSN